MSCLILRLCLPAAVSGQHLMTNVLLAKLAREFKFDERLKDTSEGNLACRFESYVGALAIVKDQQTVTEFLAPLFKRELMNMVRPKTLVVKTAPKPPTKVTATKTKAAKPSPKQPPYSESCPWFSDASRSPSVPLSQLLSSSTRSRTRVRA